MRHLEIAISGCGPAGLAAACFLADAGHQPVIYERFAEARPVGAGLMLQPAGLMALERIGCRAEVEALGSRITRFRGQHAPDWRQLVEVDYSRLPGDLYGLGIHRASLFTTLQRAAGARGIAIRTATDIADVLPGPHGRLRPLGLDGRELPAVDLVIDASGVNSRLRRLVGAAPSPSPYRYGAIWASLPNTDFARDVLLQRYVAARHMVGVLPVGHLPDSPTPLVTLFWSLRPEDHGALLAAGFEAWRGKVAAIWPQAARLLDDTTEFSAFALARYAQFTLRVPYAEGIVFIGDAAHSTSPQLGAGVTMAMLDAAALTDALAASDSLPTAQQTYAGRRNRHIRFYQMMSRLLTPLFQSDTRLLADLRDAAMPLIDHFPWLRRRMTETFAGLGTGLFTAARPDTLAGCKF
ncbi:FAD-dependent oxidoreductase [Dongia rigui]|uniref:NAD(P)/FAD-dependent oxidoreductase n=1 Tax=Dongia rigui TaxID=940149 RepID=A0ABU5DV51_9PROT|nr:NAD(P)/FAD-dependent oxidoreductase [Dongia rigui]MDY0870814.1 NAD(P)/FAD-dependent oxidoreductase [Dongia rigui]